MHELQAAQQDATLAREHAQTVLDMNQILNGHIADLLKEKEEMMRAGTGLQERLHDIESQQEAREALLRQEADAAHYRIVITTSDYEPNMSNFWDYYSFIYI